MMDELHSTLASYVGEDAGILYEPRLRVWSFTYIDLRTSLSHLLAASPAPISRATPLLLSRVSMFPNGVTLRVGLGADADEGTNGLVEQEDTQGEYAGEVYWIGEECGLGLLGRP
jgi:hypothetical protein